MAGLPLHPKHPERVCWGCPRYCPAHDLACGNGSVRTPHPEELFGADWQDWAHENGIDVGGPDPSLQEDDCYQKAAVETDCTPFIEGRRCRDSGKE